MKTLITALALSAAFTPGLATTAYATSHTGDASVPAKAAMSDGEIRKVDKEAGKLTIRHGPLENLGMPAMTMVFQVADPAVLETVKGGDQVRFSADKVGGAYTVTQLEHVK
jgi:Cu(I)/Ag(I) efflux system protein CusF